MGIYSQTNFFGMMHMVMLEHTCQDQPAPTVEPAVQPDIFQQAKWALGDIVGNGCINFSLGTHPEEFWSWSQQLLMQQKRVFSLPKIIKTGHRNMKRGNSPTGVG